MGIQIHELTALNRAPQTGDVLAVDTGTTTNKVDYSALRGAVLTDAVRTDDDQNLTDAQKAQAIENIGAATQADVTAIEDEIGNTTLPTTAQTITGAITEVANGAVRYDIAQSLTSSEQIRARNNIGAANGAEQMILVQNYGKCLRFNEQTLTESQKTQARTNIGAASEADTDALETLVGNTTLPTTAQTVTGAIAEHETDISGINSAIGTVPSGANLQGEVDDLKSAFLSKISLVSGIWNTNGTTSYANTRGRSISKYDIQDYSSISFPSGYVGRLYLWNDSMSGGSTSDWANEIDLTPYYSLSYARYFAIVVKDGTDDTTDISSLLSTIASGIIFTKATKKAYAEAIKAQNDLQEFKNDGVVFESGSFSGDGVSKLANTSRMRTVNVIDLTKVSALAMPTGYELSAYLLDGTKTKISQTSYLSSITFLEVEPTAKYANVFLKKSDDASGDISAYVNVVNSGITVQTVSENSNYEVVLPFNDFAPDLSIFKTDGGYSTDFAPQSKYIRITNGVTAFISTNGNDSNDGLTVATPKKTLESALSISNVQTVIALEGTYKAGTNYTAGLRMTQAINLVGLGEVIFDNENNAPITFARSAYCENIHFKRGNDNNVIFEDYNGDSTFVLYKCIFSESSALNGVRIYGGTAYVVECVCHDNAYDGFNYHNKDSTPNKTVEIDCESYNNGKIDLDLDAGNTSNATTIHGDCIIVRVNGDYKACHGAIVADQGKYSVNYGCKAGLSTITSATYDNRKANYWATQSVEMWLYDCDSYGSKYDTYCAGTATLHSNRTYPSMG